MIPTNPAPLATPLAAARDAAVICDLAPLSVLAITGPDAVAFLQGQLSTDVAALDLCTASHTSFNSPQGRMLANFVLWRDGPSDFRALMPGDIAGAVGKRLKMYVLRSKVAVDDVSALSGRLGVGGPRAKAVLEGVLGAGPANMAVLRAGDVTVIGLPGQRYVALAPVEQAAALLDRLGRDALEAPYPVWEWLTVRAGIPVVTAPIQNQIVAQAANWDVLGGLDFRKGCYTGQEIIARMQYLGRLKERSFAFHADHAKVGAGARLYGPPFGDQACGLVVNAAPAPGGGTDFLAVVQLAAVEAGELRLDAPDGPLVSPLPLPYEVPPPAPPRGRVGAPA